MGIEEEIRVLEFILLTGGRFPYVWAANIPSLFNLNKVEERLDTLKKEFASVPKQEDKDDEKGCGAYESKGAYTFTCGESSRAGNIQLCKKCKQPKSKLKSKNNDFTRENSRPKDINKEQGYHKAKKGLKDLKKFRPVGRSY